MLHGSQRRAVVFTGAKLISVGFPGSGVVCGGPVEPRSRERRQRPKPGSGVGLGACSWVVHPARA